jgi:hypothetical protein
LAVKYQTTAEINRSNKELAEEISANQRKNGETKAQQHQRMDNSKVVVGKQVRPIMEEYDNDLARATFARWVAQDSVSGSKWLAGLDNTETGGVRDLLACHLVGYLILKGDKVSAEQWVASITEPKLRREAEAKLRK